MTEIEWRASGIGLFKIAFICGALQNYFLQMENLHKFIMTAHQYHVVAHLIRFNVMLLVDTGFEISTVPDADNYGLEHSPKIYV